MKINTYKLYNTLVKRASIDKTLESYGINKNLVNKDRLKHFIKKYNLNLPKDYKKFIETYQGLNLPNGIEVFGLTSNNKSYPDLEFIKNNIQTESDSNKFKDFVPLTSLNGYYYFLNSNKSSKDFGSVFNEEGKKVFNNFTDFIKIYSDTKKEK